MLRWTGERITPEQGGFIFRDHKRRYEFASPLCKDRKVLDVACGEGYGTKILKENATSVTGVDIDLDVIKHASEKYKDWFYKYDLENQFPQGHYDVVVSFETIEHLKDPTYFLQQCNWHSNMFVFSIPIMVENEFHKRLYTIDDIKHLIRKHFPDKSIDYHYQPKDGEITKNEKDAKYVIGIARNTHWHN